MQVMCLGKKKKNLDTIPIFGAIKETFYSPPLQYRQSQFTLKHQLFPNTDCY